MALNATEYPVQRGSWIVLTILSTTKNDNHLHSSDFDIWVNLGGISSFGWAAWILASLQLIHVHTTQLVWFLAFAGLALSTIRCKFFIVSGLAKRDDPFKVLFSLPSSIILVVCWDALHQTHCWRRTNQTRGRHIATLLTSKTTHYQRKQVCPQTPPPTRGGGGGTSPTHSPDAMNWMKPRTEPTCISTKSHDITRNLIGQKHANSMSK